MLESPTSVFAFEEGDHLTRIHLKLALEDVGFAVVEHAATISIEAPDEQATARRIIPAGPDLRIVIAE